MKRNKTGPHHPLLPMALWTTVFVAVPLCLGWGLSFMKRRPPGGGGRVLLRQLQNLLNPVYPQGLRPEFWVAILTTVFALLIGYPLPISPPNCPRSTVPWC